MKKFAELERIQSEIATSSPAPEENKENVDDDNDNNNSNNNNKNKEGTPVTPATEEGLTEEQLQEVFKRTSAFTVRSAMMDTHDEDLDAMELWQVEFHENNIDELFEEEYVHFIIISIVVVAVVFFIIFMYLVT